MYSTGTFSCHIKLQTTCTTIDNQGIKFGVANWNYNNLRIIKLIVERFHSKQQAPIFQMYLWSTNAYIINKKNI